MSRRILPGLILLSTAADVQPQDRAYHEWLADMLVAEHGIADGTPVLGGTSDAVSRARPTGVATRTRAVRGQPFTTALRVQVAEAEPEPWARTVRFDTRTPLRRGDVLLAAVWLRGRAADGSPGQVQARVEQADSPWTGSLDLSFAVSEQWQLALMPFEAAIDQPAGHARLQLNAGFLPQWIEIGGLAVLNFRDRHTLDELPERLPVAPYAGQEPGAAWREAARVRIEQHRMGELAVRVVDARGRPVEGARVHLAMRRHAFRFGSFDQGHFLTAAGADADRYRRAFERLFNFATVGIYWPTFEEGPQPTLEALDWLDSKGIPARAHPVLWMKAGSWSPLPGDVRESRDPAFIRRRIDGRLRDVAEKLGDRVVEYDVLNEYAHEQDLMTLLDPDEPAEWFREMHALDPDASLYINDYSILSRRGRDRETQREYRAIVADLLETGAPVQGIGMQAHMGAIPTPPGRLLEILDAFAGLGLEIQITEFDLHGMDEDQAGRYLHDLLVAVFSHPAAVGFVMWGFWDGRHWLDDAPLFRKDWTLKPAGKAYEELVLGEWWTDEVVTTDGDGEAAVPAFFGKYDIVVSRDGRTVERRVTHAPRRVTPFVVPLALRLSLPVPAPARR